MKAEVSVERYIIVFKKDASGFVANGESRGADFEPMIKENGSLNDRVATSAIENAGGKFIKSIAKQRMAVASMNKRAYNNMLKNQDVESVSVDAKRYLAAETQPYGIPMVQATLLSQSNKSARKVCVIDTGFNGGHPDLPNATGVANNGSVGAWNNDGHGHGTHVAGTIAALDNSIGVIGVYPGVDTHVVKIFNDSGSWVAASDLVQGIQQCIDGGADVVNMSLSGPTFVAAENTAMQNFVNGGTMLVAAAGNDGNSAHAYPASYDSVVSVAAVDSSANHASYSQTTDQVELAGPGSSVYSTVPSNSYGTKSGTSMATPHVVGVAALVWSFHQSCSNEQVREALQATAQDRGAAGRDNLYGWGIVKASDAHNYLNSWGCAGDPDFPPTSGGGVDPFSGQLTGLSGSTGNWDRYTWTIPAGVATMTVATSGGSGDADLYTKFGSQPSSTSYDCRPYKGGNNETCTHSNPSAGTWHIGIYAYSTYSGVTMDYSYQ